MFLFLSYKPNKICAILILQCIKVFYTEIGKKHIRRHKDKEFLWVIFFCCKAHYIIPTILLHSHLESCANGFKGNR